MKSSNRIKSVKVEWLLRLQIQKKIFRAALEFGASALILCHNHPSGNLSPSPADFKLTEKLVKAGKNIDISVLDHIIVTNQGYYSFVDEGKL